MGRFPDLLLVAVLERRLDRAQSLSGLVKTYRDAGTNAVHPSPPPAPDNNLVIGSIFLLFAGGAKASAALGFFHSLDFFQVNGC